MLGAKKVESLYLDDHLSRSETREINGTRRQFFFFCHVRDPCNLIEDRVSNSPSMERKQLKYRFNEWGLKKYINDRDLATMLSFQKKVSRTWEGYHLRVSRSSI